MKDNQTLITKFYTAFASHDAEKMASCYHPLIIFSDPVFGTLEGNEVPQMWKMLIERSNGNLNISFSDVKTHNDSGSAKWAAAYLFGKTNRHVVNKVTAEFKFSDGLMIRHDDNFNLWKWSWQAFGFKGLLLGWTGFMRNKISQQARKSLELYMSK